MSADRRRGDHLAAALECSPNAVWRAGRLREIAARAGITEP